MVQFVLYDQKMWFFVIIIEFLYQVKLFVIGEDDIIGMVWQQDVNVIIDVLVYISFNYDDCYVQILLCLIFNGYVVCFFVVVGKWNDEVMVKVVNLEVFIQFNVYLMVIFSKLLVIDE